MQSELTVPRRALQRFTTFVAGHLDALIPYVLIVLFGIAVFTSALSILPTSADDLILLSSVYRTGNPLSYFWSDWGFGLGTGYRPLHSVVLWTTYQVFGVWAVPGELINVVLHIVITCLLYRFIAGFQPDRVIAFLAVCLSYFSIYTVSPATWVSDRPTLFVALALVLLLNILFSSGQPRQQPSIALVAICCIVALIGKESGLVVPVVAIYFAFVSGQPARYRNKLVAAALTIIAMYIALRLLTLGHTARMDRAFGIDSGYLFGRHRYESGAELSSVQKVYSLVETFLKNVLAPFFPVFNLEGGIDRHWLVLNSPFWFGIPLLTWMAARNKLSTVQKIALVIVIVNALIHVTYFRYRLLYLPQIAVSVFIGTSAALIGREVVNVMFKVLATVVVALGIFTTSRYITRTQLDSLDALNTADMSSMVRQFEGRMDPAITQEVLEYYGAPR